MPHRAGIVAAVTFAATVLLAWLVLRYLPGLSDRIGDIASPGAPQATRIGETRAGLLVPGAVIAGALLLGFVTRQPARLGGGAPALTASALPAGAIGVAGALALSWAAGGTSVAPHGSATGGTALLVGWLLVAWSALGEELLFRGVLQPVLLRACGPVAALGLGALAFTIVHYLGGWRDPISLANIFLAALWFGLLALRTGGVLAPLLAHIGWNGVEALVFGASPNPGTGVYGSLLDVDLDGPALLGGSGDGLNASVTATAMLLALIASLVLSRRMANGRAKDVRAAG